MAEMGIACMEHQPTKTTAEGICAEEGEFDDEKMENPEREGEMVEYNSECDGRSRNSATIGGYNKDRPPEDDCCPICFDEFRFPCRTNCGHWFCSSCILELWRYSTSVKPCNCPMCGCSIAKLVPDSSVLIQTGEEVHKILNNIRQYNRLTGGGLAGLFLKVLALPMVIRRRAREYLSPLMLRNIYNVVRLVGIFLGMLYDSYNFRFFPTGGLWIQFVFEICGFILVMFLIFDTLWYHWKLRRRARNLARNADLA